MSNVGAISDWGALTAAQIQKYEQEGYDVPVEYRQWADSATNLYVTYDAAQTQYQVSEGSDTSASGLSGDSSSSESADGESFNAHSPSSVFKAGGVADSKSAEADESGDKAVAESGKNKQMTKKLKTRFAALNNDVKKNQSKVKNLTGQKNAETKETSENQDQLDQTNDEIEDAINEDQEEQERQADEQKAKGAQSRKGAPKRGVAVGDFSQGKTAGVAGGNQEDPLSNPPVDSKVVTPRDEKANSTGIGVNSAFSLKLADEDKKAPVRANRAPAKGKKAAGSQNVLTDDDGSDTIATRSAAISKMANLYSTQAVAAMAVSAPAKAPAVKLTATPTTGNAQGTAGTTASPVVTPTATTNTPASSKVADKQATAADLTTKIAASTTKTTQLTSQITTTTSATSKDYQEIEKLIQEAKKQAAESQKDSTGGKKFAETLEKIGKTIQTVGGLAITIGAGLIATGWASAVGAVLETYGAYASYAGGGLAAISEAVQGKWGACLMTAVEVGAVAAAQATNMIGAGAKGAAGAGAGAGSGAGAGAGSGASGTFQIGSQTYNANGELIAGEL